MISHLYEIVNENNNRVVWLYKTFQRIRLDKHFVLKYTHVITKIQSLLTNSYMPTTKTFLNFISNVISQVPNLIKYGNSYKFNQEIRDFQNNGLC